MAEKLRLAESQRHALAHELASEKQRLGSLSRSIDTESRPATPHLNRTSPGKQNPQEHSKQARIRAEKSVMASRAELLHVQEDSATKPPHGSESQSCEDSALLNRSPRSSRSRSPSAISRTQRGALAPLGVVTKSASPLRAPEGLTQKTPTKAEAVQVMPDSAVTHNIEQTEKCVITAKAEHPNTSREELRQNRMLSQSLDHIAPPERSASPDRKARMAAERAVMLAHAENLQAQAQKDEEIVKTAGMEPNMVMIAADDSIGADEPSTQPQNSADHPQMDQGKSGSFFGLSLGDLVSKGLW